MTSPIISLDIENEIAKFHEALLATSIESEESGVSDNKVPDISEHQDQDYQEFLPTTVNSTSCPTTKTSFLHPKGITLI